MSDKKEQPKKVETLATVENEAKTCFVIMPIADTEAIHLVISVGYTNISLRQLAEKQVFYQSLPVM